MKVVHLSTYDYRGGAAIVCRRLVKALRDQNIEATMLVMESKSGLPFVQQTTSSRLKHAYNLARLAWEKFVFLFHQKDGSVRFQFSAGNTGEALARHPLLKEADIIHLHWINHGFLSIKGIGEIFQTGKPVVWTLHDMWPFTGGCHHSGECEQYKNECGQCPFMKHPAPDDLSFAILQQKKEQWGKFPVALIACSKWLEEKIKKSALFKDRPVHTIANPIDTSLFSPKEKKELKRRKGFDPGKFHILFGAENIKNYHKGVSFFIEAMQHLKNREGKNIEIILFGKHAEDIVPSLPFVTYIQGTIKDEKQMADLYALSDVYVTSSIQENLPTTIMESFSCGTPVVAFHTGGIPEMITHLQDGYVASYRSSEDLARGIYTMLYEKDPVLAGTKARQKALSSYKESLIARQYIQVYRQLLSNK